MAKTINRYFQLLSSSRDVKPSARLWDPAADIYTAPDGWLVKVELAGVSAEDIEIEIADSCLTLSGTRRDRVAERGVSYHRMEITYSRFEKTIQFPKTIEGASVETSFDNGLFLVRVRK
jgi:HSP20 family protein